MELDAVVQPFEAQTADFVRNVEAAVEAAKQFADAVHQDIDALLELQAVLDGLPLEKTIHVRVDTSGVPEAAAAAAAGAGAPNAGATRDTFAVLDDILGEYEAMQQRAGEASAASGAEATAAAAGFDAEAASAQLASADVGLLAKSERDLADAMLVVDAANLAALNSSKSLQDATDNGAQSARNATRFWGVLPLTWNAIHWAITGVAEALAVVVPAMVALGAAGMVGLQGAVDVAQRMDAVYQATEATYSYLGKTVSTGLAQGLDSFTASAGQAANAGAHLHDELQQAQNAAQPHVYELLGAAIDGANEKFNVFNQIGSQTIDMLDRFGAKIDIELRGPLGNLGQQIGQNSVGDLQQLGQVFGNIGHAIAYAAGEMPGMANLLLTILDDGTQVLNWALHFQGVLEALFLAHEAYMWGGVLQNVLGGITGALGKATTAVGTFAVRSAEMAGFETVAAGVDEAAAGMAGALESTAAFMAGPWGLAIGAAAVAAALLIPKLMDAKTATQQWVSSVEQSVSQASGLEQIAATYSGLQQMTAAAAHAQVQLGQAVGDSANRVQGVEERFTGGYTPAVSIAAEKAQDLSAAQQQLSQDWSAEIGNVQYLSNAYKISYVDAAQLASDAGVSLTQTLKGNSFAAQEARQMITNLIAGYGGMASVGSELGQDINAVSLATEIQNGDVSKLNQAWDTFISTVQAPSSTFLSFAQSLAQFSQDAGQAGASMDGLGGSYTKASHDVDQAAIQLQQDFNTSVSSAEQMLDSMRTVAAVTGNGGPLTAGIKDTVAALIPMAGTNKAAQAQLFALAQEAGGPASGSMQALAKWTGNTKDPLNQLYNLSMQASTALQKLGADTQALAATVQSTLNQTLVTEAQNLTGVSGKTATYLSDLQKFGPSAAVTQAALANLNDATSQSTTLASQAADGINVLSQKEQQQADAARQASAPTQQLNTDIQGLLQKAPNASSAIQNLTNAIESQGLKSSSAASARAQLLKDLEAAGVKAQQATLLVNDLATAISRIPTTKNITFSFSETGATGVVNASPVRAAAEGWHVPGYGGGDTVPAMLEPGEAVVPKHLVSGVAPFLAAHHVPGFAAGGKVGAWDMADVFALWGKEVWAQDLHGHGPGHPIAEAAIKALLTSVTQPKKLSGIWDNPLWRGFAGDLKADMSGYAAKDLEYWTVLGDEKALKAAEKAKIAHDLHEMHLHHLKDQPGWVSYYEKQMHSLETADSKTLVNYAAMLGVLRREGFSSGGPVRSYDSGGYLPVGLSMAYNGTGRPEAVGGGGAPEVHVHLHGDLADDTIWDRMQAKTLDYGYNNTGRPTGVWQPGG